MELPGELRRMLWATTSSFIVFIYIGIFVNLYIWESNRDIFQVAWFNLILFLIWPFAFFTAAKLLTVRTIRLTLGVSSVFGFVTFVQLSFLKLDNQLLWITVIALPAGIMWGFFAATQNLCLSQFGKGKEFGAFFSASNTIAQLLNMTVPVISAIVIRWYGYKGSSLLMLVFVSLMLCVSFYLPRYSIRHAKAAGWRDWLLPSRVFRSPGSWLLIPSSAAAGIFLQFQALFALLFTFIVAQDKMVIALLNALYTGCTVLALYLYRKHDRNEAYWLKVSVLLVVVGFAAVLSGVPGLLIMSNVLTIVGVFYFNTALSSRQFRSISRHDGIRQPGLLLWRESCVCLGRLLMLTGILHVRDFHGTLYYMLMALSLASLLSVLFIEKYAEAAAGKRHDHHLGNTSL